MVDKSLATLKDVFRIAFFQKAQVLIFLFGASLAAITEMAFLGLLYAVFSVDKAMAVLGWVKSKIYFNPAQSSFLDKNIIYILIACGVAMLFLRLFFAILGRFALARVQVRTSVKLSKELLSAFVDAHPMAWVSWKRERIVHILAYETGISGEVIYTALNMLMSLMVMSALLTGSFLISVKLTIFSLLIGIIVLGINYTNYLKAKSIGVVKNKSKAQLLGNVYDIVCGHKILKLEGGEGFAKTRSSGVISDSYSWVLGKAKNINTVMSFSELFIYFFFFGLVLMGHIFKIADQATLLTLLIISIRLQGSVGQLQNQWLTYQELLPNFLDVRKAIFHARDFTIKEKIRPLTAIKRGGMTVRLDGLNFAYTDGGPGIIKDLDIVFPGGRKILIKGKSGSGKSTFINMVSGMLQQASGKIFYDDEELTAESFYHFRRLVSYSSPDAYIFKGTIKSNISLGLDKSDDEILGCAKRAGLEEFMKKLENGIYSTVVDNAANISMGERQRLMLARMFLKKPRLILLDEATSNLDLELEDKILKNLIEHLPEATLIMVTHRAPKNFIFDKMFELKDGKLVGLT